MSKPSVVTLRIPNELKSRLEAAAHKQGVSVNQYALYILTGEVTRLEAREQQEQWQRMVQSYLQHKSPAEIQQEGLAVLDAVTQGDIPAWDQLPES